MHPRCVYKNTHPTWRDGGQLRRSRTWGSHGRTPLGSSPAEIASRLLPGLLYVQQACCHTVRPCKTWIHTFPVCVSVAALGDVADVHMEAGGRIGVGCFHYSINCGTGSLLGKKTGCPRRLAAAGFSFSREGSLFLFTRAIQRNIFAGFCCLVPACCLIIGRSGTALPSSPPDQLSCWAPVPNTVPAQSPLPIVPFPHLGL